VEFTEIKTIWDSQNQEPLYAFNEAALHAIVQRKNREMNRCLARCFAAEISVGLFSAILMLVYAGVLAFGDQSWLIKPWGNRITPSTWHYVGLFVASALWLYYAAYMYRARKRQQRQVEVFDSSLRGDLDRALSQNEFQIAMTRDNAWRGLAPMWVAATLWMVVLFHLKGAVFWGYLLMVAISIVSLALVVWRKHRSIKQRLVPRQRELESLRAKLADTER
jgi:hypothetical protein